MKHRFVIVAVILAAVVLGTPSVRAQTPAPAKDTKSTLTPAPAKETKTALTEKAALGAKDAVLEDMLSSADKAEGGNQEEAEKILRGDLGQKAGDLKTFEIRTETDITTLQVGDLYKNEETAYKIVAVKKKSAKGGLFTAQRIAGQSDPKSRWTLVSGSGPKTIITLMTLLDFYAQGGIFMHPLALLFIAMLVLVVNDSLLYRVKAQCPAAFVTAAEAALRQGDLSRFEELARNTKGLMPFICRQLTVDLDESSISEIRTRVEAAVIARVNRMRIPVRALNLIAVSAPLLGLMGTIAGMVTVFEGIADTSGSNKASILAGGIRTALFTTIAGLTVAIPALYAYFLLNQKHDGIVGMCESIHERFLHLLGKIKRDRKQGGSETEDDVRPTAALGDGKIAVVSQTRG
jgi:biopolymer transport protein ExbB